MASQTFAVLTLLLRVFEEFYHVWLRAKYILVPLFEAQLIEPNLSGRRGHCPKIISGL